MVLIKIFAAPIIWVFILLILGLALSRGIRRQGRAQNIGWRLLLAGVCVFYVLSITPVANMFLYSLESGLTPPSKEELSKVNIMVILGGGIEVSGGFRARPEASGATYARVFNGVEAFRKSKAGVLVLSGGSIDKPGETEAEVMENIALALGVNESAILLEKKSRDTMEQALEIRKLVPVNKDTRIALVTSALHMKRSLRTFKKIFPGSAITAVPANYTYSPLKLNYKTFIPSAEAFTASTIAAHEWIGMVWYSLRGRSS